MTKLERIKEMEQQLQALKAEVEAESKVEKWSPKGGEWHIRGDGSFVNYFASSHSCREFGTEYQTEEQAIKARDIMRRHNRLLTWLAENDDGWVADWKDTDQRKYFIYLAKDGLYRISYVTLYKALGTVYMSEANANKLCKLLNEGVVEL